MGLEDTGLTQGNGPQAPRVSQTQSNQVHIFTPAAPTLHTATDTHAPVAPGLHTAHRPRSRPVNPAGRTPGRDPHVPPAQGPARPRTRRLSHPRVSRPRLFFWKLLSTPLPLGRKCSLYF